MDENIVLNFNQIISNVIKKRYIYGSVFYISSRDETIDLISAAGNLEVNSKYYIA